MFVHVPAMKGKMGNRTYYSALMPLSAIPNLFKFTNWVGFSPEDRGQRVLNEKRIPEIAKYMLENEDDYLFASITASYKSDPVFVQAQDPGNDAAIGILKLKLGDELIINDGQHRCKAIAAALEENPALGEQTISVLLFPYENLERVQQMFSDLNKNVEKTSKSLDILYDHRDPVSIATMFALDKVKTFKELTEKERISLKAKDTKLFTLAAFYDANVELLKGQEDDVEGNTKRLVEFWDAVATHMPDWSKVLHGQKSSMEMRAQKICAHSTVLRALGGVGAELMKEVDWKERLSALEKIDWERKNPEWQDICIVANSVISNRQARAATKAFIKDKMGLPLSEGEQRAVAKVGLRADIDAAFKDTGISVQ